MADLITDEERALIDAARLAGAVTVCRPRTHSAEGAVKYKYGFGTRMLKPAAARRAKDRCQAEIDYFAKGRRGARSARLRVPHSERLAVDVQMRSGDDRGEE